MLVLSLVVVGSCCWCSRCRWHCCCVCIVCFCQGVIVVVVGVVVVLIGVRCCFFWPHLLQVPLVLVLLLSGACVFVAGVVFYELPLVS